MLDATKRWYALYVKSRHEKYAADLMEKKGIEVYLPLQRTLKQWSDRKKYVDEPLFKSYVFVKVNNADYLQALDTPGVIGFVTIAKEKVPIPEVQILAIKTYLGEVVMDNSLDYFKVGTEVEVAYGSLKGLRGKLITAKDQRKLVVQIDVVKQNITLTLPAHLLNKVNRPS